MTSVEQFEDSAEHEAREGEVVKGGECLGEAFVVSGQSAESCGPSEASLDDPSARQQDEAAFGLGVLDDLQLNAVPGGCAVSGRSAGPHFTRRRHCGINLLFAGRKEDDCLLLG